MWESGKIYEKSVKVDRNMNTKQIQYALALSETLNFSQVADRLGITQPALSKQIQHLENELGVKLFDRSVSPLAVTPAGEYFLAEARKMLYQQEQLARSMQDFQEGNRGCLTIGISPFRAFYFVSDVLRQVKEKYPDIRIALHETSSDILRKEAAEGKYDFAIVNLPVDEAVLDVTLLEADDLVLAVPERFCESLPETEAVDFADCGQVPFVVVGKNQEMRLLFEKSCAAADVYPEIAMEVVGLSTAWAMCRAGIGATLLPKQFVESMDDSGGMKLYAFKRHIYTRQPAIVTKRGQYLSECARYAIDLLAKNV